MFFNRDERKSREPASPPAEFHDDSGMPYIAALDGNFGGTWLFVNGAGLSVGLLNYYDADTLGDPTVDGEKKTVSRGHLVLSFTHCRSMAEVTAEMVAADLRQIRPFHLVAIADRDGPRLWTWNGARLSDTADPPRPMTTSSFQTESVLARRRRAFASARPATFDQVSAYHRQFDPADSAHSVCMMRPDAQTWSISSISVDESSVVHRYESRGRDQLDFAPPIVTKLARV